MKEEYCGSCGAIIRFPETARKVICEGCDTEWQVVRTGSIISLAPMGVMQTVGQEETLQKKLKDLDRQARIKLELFQKTKREIDEIIIDIKPLPVVAIVGAAAACLFFLAGAAGARFFAMPIAYSAALAALAVAPFVGLAIFKRQLNAGEREKILQKKELVGKLALIKHELDELKGRKQKAGEEAVIEES